ncbi:MAG: hypothetical protein AAFU64_03625, partial [Bacteroidota bacterium]
MKQNYFLRTLAVLLFLRFFVPSTIHGQSKATYEESLYEALEYRLLGPFRGGRSCTVAGVPGKPNLY